MPLDKAFALNQANKIPQTSINATYTVNETIYTCPSGKKAIITGECIGVGTGGSTARIAIYINSVLWRIWSNAAGTPTFSISTVSGISVIPINVTLLAGQVLETSNVGGFPANQVSVFLNIKELPI